MSSLPRGNKPAYQNMLISKVPGVNLCADYPYTCLLTAVFW